MSENYSSNSNANDVQVLLFEIKNSKINQKFGLNIFKVQEIVTCPHVTHIANSDPAILGLIKSRDEFMPLLDLSMVLSNLQGEEKKEPLIIICHGSGRKLALLVDNVSNIISSNWKEMHGADSISTGNTYINGFISFEDELISILNLEEIMLKYLGSNEPEVQICAEKVKNKKVLVVDDSKWVHKIIDEKFKEQGIHYFGALNGQLALEMVKSQGNHYDLILCDIEMPVLSGYMFLEEVNKLRNANSGITIPPIVMYSSLCDDVSIAKAKDLGAKHYITKYNMDKIVKAIEDFTN